MGNQLILAYDIGTSSVKTSLVTETGEVYASAKCDYDTHHPEPGISEQNPEDWWKCACKTTKTLLEQKPDAGKRIAAIGVSGHMLGCVPVDEKCEALHAALIHSDSRAGAQFEAIKAGIGKEELYRISGNVLDSRSSLCKMLWFKEERPEIYRKTAKFLQSKDFLTARLTGNIDTTDYSDASHGELMNIHKKAYDAAVYRELGLEMEKLPELHAGMEIVGHVTEEAAKELGIPSGIPVIAGGGDGACADIGAGNVNTGDIYCSLGTTAWLSQCIEQPYLDPEQRIFNIMSLDGIHSSLFGTMQSAGGALKWVMNVLGTQDLDEFNALAGKIAPGSDGLIFVPYLDGERSPIFDAKARGMFFGLSMRQFVFSVLAILVAVGLYFLLKPHFGTETVSWMCILGAAPFAALGFITYHGMTAEQFLWAWLRSELLEPKALRFEASNLYYEALKDKLEGGKS